MHEKQNLRLYLHRKKLNESRYEEIPTWADEVERNTNLYLWDPKVLKALKELCRKKTLR